MYRTFEEAERDKEMHRANEEAREKTMLLKTIEEYEIAIIDLRIDPRDKDELMETEIEYKKLIKELEELS